MTLSTLILEDGIGDRLHQRQEKLERSMAGSQMSARYHDGKIAITETDGSVKGAWIDDVSQAIAWIEKNASILPVVIDDEMDEQLGRALAQQPNDIFDAMAIALQQRLVLISDDLPTRRVMDTMTGSPRSAWLAQVFETAYRQRRIDFRQYLVWKSDLIAGGHSYISVTGDDLAVAAHLDQENGSSPGNYFITIASVIGGSEAEPKSHIMATVGCLQHLWNDAGALEYREAATGRLISNLLRGRGEYPAMVRAVMKLTRSAEASNYIRRWWRGHFYEEKLLEGAD